MQKVMHATFFNFRSFHIRNFSLEGLPFYLGVAIYCYEVGDCLRVQWDDLSTKLKFREKEPLLVLGLGCQLLSILFSEWILQL